MTTTTLRDRAQGAILGAFIGDALGLGPHWYYDLNELRADYGAWVDDYTDPKPGRYHDGLKAGQLSQSGYILSMMIRSLIDCGGYDESDFCRRLDEELFPQLDGTPVSGPGRYTSQSIRDVWRQRIVSGMSWQETGSHADTTEAIERTLAIAVRYATRPAELATAVADNTVLTQTGRYRGVDDRGFWSGAEPSCAGTSPGYCFIDKAYAAGEKRGVAFSCRHPG